MIIKQILEWDARNSDRMRLNPKSKFLWDISVFLAHSGDSWWWLAGLLPIWLVGLFISPLWHRIAGILAFSLLLEAVLVLAVKFIVRRKRPEGDWGGIYRSTDPHSFPSGHAARMFLIALMSWFIAPLWFSILLLFWAPLVCAARVAMGVHYLSDVIVGALVGLLSGFLMVLWLPTIEPLVNSFIPIAF